MTFVTKINFPNVEEINDQAEDIMEYVRKALAGNLISKLTKRLGLDEDDDEKDRSYGHMREQKEKDKRLREKARRNENHAKRKAERAKMRNEIRMKYGLKDSKTDYALLENTRKTKPLTKPKDDDKGKILTSTQRLQHSLRTMRDAN